MKILMSGSSGLVGTETRKVLIQAGHSVCRLVRRPPSEGEFFWDPSAGRLDAADLEGFDAVVHLAGENIGAKARWTASHKQRVRDSRLQSTRLLAGALAGLNRPPAVLVCASATGIYGHRGGELLAETAPPGSGFLAELCRDWEAAAAPASQAGVRVVHLRLGIILALAGGALPAMLPWFRRGLGGRLGDGRQWWSWLTLQEAAGMIRFVLDRPDLHGPVNAVSPSAVTNAEFTRALARALKRPALLPAPAFMLQWFYGEMADALLLCSARVRPAALEARGYPFLHSDLETALDAVLRER